MAFLPFLLPWILFHSLSFSADNSGTEQVQQRARALKTFLQKEKADFDLRETQKKTLLESLDDLNAKQNLVRSRLEQMAAHQQELNMSLENLALEYKNQKELERTQRKRLFLILKVVYKIQKEGMVRFLFYGPGISQLAGRVRVLFYTLRSHSQVTKQIQDRAQKLAATEAKLKTMKEKVGSLSEELRDQQYLLENLLKNKKRLVERINEKQSSYKLASKEYQRVSNQLSKLFKELPSAKKGIDSSESLFEPKGNLPMPAAGTIVQGFGKNVHEKFGTVTYHKGIEIEADFNSPVSAILPGGVEFAGWLRGLGNVMILHHGQGLYTLSAHLFKFNKNVGETVEAGEIVGFVGDTGNRAKPSLYFEIREKGKAVDPLAYLSANPQSSLN